MARMTTDQNTVARPVQQSPEWQALMAHADTLKNSPIIDFFKDDGNRFKKFSKHACGLLLDLSKNRVTAKTFDLLISLAHEQKLDERIKQLFAGEVMNVSENRAAKHMALRSGLNQSVTDVLRRMDDFTQAVHDGTRTGFSGKAFTDVVCIGIGGSMLGPKMAVQALKPYATSPLNLHFVSNVDAADLMTTLSHIHPETTLFLVASKTFTTQETMINARSAKNWITAAAPGKDFDKHFVALTANADRALDFGIQSENIFEFWDWVGGRFSLWSSIGMPIALAVGMDNFNALLSGAKAMDNHFLETPAANNLPILLALIGIWNVNFQNHSTHGIFPYDHSLAELPRYLQQLEMESNGKGVTLQGDVFNATAPVIFGEAGTNSQHSFFQLLHQGRDVVSADFIAAATSFHRAPHHHDHLLANFLAQSEALMAGQAADQSAPLSKHQNFPGNRPSNSILMESLTPENLGALIALYEHKVFVQSVIWNINPFDQWGVELGKQLAQKVLPELSKTTGATAFSSSTNGLLAEIKRIKDKSDDA